jgi:hypothetical protein
MTAVGAGVLSGADSKFSGISNSLYARGANPVKPGSNNSVLGLSLHCGLDVPDISMSQKRFGNKKTHGQRSTWPLTFR